MIERMEPTGRWWLVNGREVDLLAEPGSYPFLLRSAALTACHAVTAEDEDAAAYLEWAAETNPPGAEEFAGELSWTRSQAIYVRLKAAIEAIEVRHGA